MMVKRSKRKRIGLLFTGAFLVSLLVVAAVYGYWVFVEHRLLTVTEDQVYRSGAMPLETLQNAIRKYGIRTVIDLRKPSKEVDTEHTALALMGVQHFNLPSKQVPADETIKAFLEIMDNRENRPVLIHCHNGVGRAVLFTAIYRMEYEGWSNENARRASRLILYKSAFSLDSSKGKFLQEYVPRSRLAN
jgi:protein tyrosine/serine phosphatase